MTIGYADSDQATDWYRAGVTSMFTSAYTDPEPSAPIDRGIVAGPPRGPKPFPTNPSPLPPQTQTSPLAPFSSAGGSAFGSSGPAGQTYYGASAPAKAPLPWTMIAAGVGAVVLIGAVAIKMKKKKRH